MPEVRVTVGRGEPKRVHSDHALVTRPEPDARPLPHDRRRIHAATSTRRTDEPCLSTVTLSPPLPADVPGPLAVVVAAVAAAPTAVAAALVRAASRTARTDPRLRPARLCRPASHGHRSVPSRTPACRRPSSAPLPDRGSPPRSQYRPQPCPTSWPVRTSSAGQAPDRARPSGSACRCSRSCRRTALSRRDAPAV